MSIVPASSLSSSDLARLGNNVRRRERGARTTRPGRPGRRLVAAVNRSLAGLGERVRRLHARATTSAS